MPTSAARLILAALAALAAQGAPRRAATAAEPVTVTVTDKGCEPQAVSVPAGATAFKVVNKSRRAVEWEILNGVMVVDERENIIPGLTQSLSTTLPAGDYQMTCGLLSNPKGKLTVLAQAAGGGSGPEGLSREVAEYRDYVTGEVAALVAGTRVLVDAVKAGKLDDAKQAYAPAHLHYERIEPIAEVFNDLDGSMDSRADDFEKKEADPGFIGFHRLEKALFADGTTADLGPIADRLMADALELQKRVGSVAIPAKTLVGGAANLIEEVASKKISGEEDRYSRTDLWDFQANVDGAQTIYGLLRPKVEAADGALAGRIEANLTHVDSVLAKYRTGSGGFQSYEKLSTSDRTMLKGPITALAEDFSKLRGTLAVD